ncbi:top-1 [Bugula neritina]|uniref:DNA topoisomerase I n=1 Tax=Bugula neritina TaxID=10212 RepID=A0A7J7KPZ9_BUGNE|nr:top-1 [Bugula neritina]
MDVKTEDFEDVKPTASRKRAANNSDDEADEDYGPGASASKPKKVKKEEKPAVKSKTKAQPKAAARSKNVKVEPTASPDKKKTKRELAREQEQKEVWKWWEEEKTNDGKKWKTLEHMGPVFAPEYEPLPKHVKLVYDGKEISLSENTEEVAGFYAKMLLHDYTSMDVFNKNFFKDWRKVMTPKERELITDLGKCNFQKMHAYFTDQSEKRKARSKEEKQKEKAENEKLVEIYGYCTIDGHKEKIGNFRIEPPGLFRGRGQHPKMGMLKRRVQPEDVIINCSKGSKVPVAPKGHKWKEVRSDNEVTWLATWTENIQGQIKYVMLNPASRLKGEKDWQKYEKARKLHTIIDRVRENYTNDWKSKEMKIRQRAVAIYFIDKLALRAGNEKDSDESADTVGCCSLRYEHVKLHEQKDDLENVVEFDFLGKDSIRYQNSVSVEKRVFKNLKLFMENKNEGDDLFDRLNTSILNKHLQDIMEGLTAKVFRTYNASRTLEEQLNLLTKEDDNVAAKLLAYNRANRAVAVLCNHQRAVPKNFSQQMERMSEKIENKKKDLKEANKQLKDAKQQAKNSRSTTVASNVEKKKKAVERIKEQLHKLELQATDKDENKDIALGTSKLNYLDPRISVAWCKKYDIPIEKVYNKTQRQKFMWAIDMAGPEFEFIE